MTTIESWGLDYVFLSVDSTTIHKPRPDLRDHVHKGLLIVPGLCADWKVALGLGEWRVRRRKSGGGHNPVISLAPTRTWPNMSSEHLVGTHLPPQYLYLWLICICDWEWDANVFHGQWIYVAGQYTGRTFLHITSSHRHPRTISRKQVDDKKNRMRMISNFCPINWTDPNPNLTEPTSKVCVGGGGGGWR